MAHQSPDGGRDRERVYDVCVCPPRIVSALANPRRRAVVTALLERSGSTAVSADDLVAAVAGSDSPADRTTAVAASLRHAHLPALESAGLVALEPVDDRGLAVEPGAALHQHPLARAHLATVDQRVWAALDAIHGDPLRPRILECLCDDGPVVPVDALTRSLSGPSSAPDGRVRSPGDVESALRHLHLPTLTDAGVLARVDDGVAYDAGGPIPVALADLVVALRTATGPTPGDATAGVRARSARDGSGGDG